MTHSAWSPNGKWLAFERADVVREPAGRIGPTSEIYIVEPSGTGLEQLTTDTIEDTHPTWSPDSASILWVSDSGYFRKIDLRTKAISYVWGCPEICLDPTWSPDGKWVAFQMRRSGTKGLWLLDLATLKARLLVALDHYSKGLTWSSDASTLLFTRPDPATHVDTVVRLAIDSLSATPMALGGNATYPTGYPAPNNLAFIRDEFPPKRTVSGWTKIIISKNDGTNPRSLFSDVLDKDLYSPALSSDNRVAFVYGGDIFRELYVANLP